MKNVLIKQVLEELYPDDCIIVGEETLDKLISENKNEKSLYKAKGGMDFDITSTLATLSTCIIIVKNVIEIIEKMVSQNKPKDKKDIAQETQKKLEGKIKYSIQDIEDVISQVIKHY